LDRACLQFEPDDPDFIRIRTEVFENLINCGDFNSLWSTRHFAGFVFYLVLERKIDDLLEFYAKNHRLNDIRDLLELYRIVNPGWKIDEKKNDRKCAGISFGIRQNGSEKTSGVGTFGATFEGLVENND